MLKTKARTKDCRFVLQDIQGPLHLCDVVRVCDGMLCASETNSLNRFVTVFLSNVSYARSADGQNVTLPGTERRQVSEWSAVKATAFPTSG